MPLKQCTKNGVKGWSWGNAACQTGPGAKKRAIKMGLAIEGEEGFKKEMAKSDLVTAAELEAALQPEPEPSFGNRFLDAAHAYISKKERDAMPEEDFAGPGRSYPIKDKKHLDAAVKLLGRAPKSEQAGIKKKIKEIAKRKGLALPKSWEDEK